MIDLEVLEYKDETPKETGWYAVYNRFDPTKRKLIADFNGQRLHIAALASTAANNYIFGPKLAERTDDSLSTYEKEMGIK